MARARLWISCQHCGRLLLETVVEVDREGVFQRPEVPACCIEIRYTAPAD